MVKKIFFAILVSSFVLTAGCYSCKTWQHMHGREPADPSAEFMWEKGCKPAPMPLPEKCQPECAKPVVAPPPPPPAPIVANCAAKTYPGEGCEVVRLEKCMPSQVRTGKEFEFKIKVTNLIANTLTDVVVTDTLNDNFQYKTSNPKAIVQGNKIMWVFPTLGPKESREITGTGIATASGIVKNCVDVTYKLPIKMPVCVQTVSVQPNIVISKTAPAEVSVCDSINYTIRIENSGTGSASNVRIVDNLPDGLQTAQGASKIEIPIGTLLPGTARTASIVVKPQRPGTFTNKAVAIADDNIMVESPTVTTEVKQPILSITKTGPDTLYIDRQATYEISVTNTGNWPAVDTIIEDLVPAGVTFVKASQGGAVVNDKIMWKVAKLNPGATAKTSVTYRPNGIGTIVNVAKASAVCCDAVTATAKTLVRGAPGILLEAIDLVDPIRIGEDVTYKIMVTNQGTAAGTNIVIKAMLEPQMGYISNAGATDGVYAGDTITFAPLPSLAPKARASWEIIVKAKAIGDVRFKVVMTSDQLSRVVEETESTNFYE
ncbi:MAG: hypothetical protein PHP01_03415 [Phycisphaerae bacterium]|nr:hypothetical protein [Phycisphaerae bacterium]